MQTVPARPAGKAPAISRAPDDNLWHGIMVGIVPLGMLVLMIGVTLGLTAVVRDAFFGQGFSAYQTGALITIGAGLLASFIIYAIGLVHVWRQMASWREAGLMMQATSTLWTLAVTVLIVLLPFLLALLLPQHPVP